MCSVAVTDTVPAKRNGLFDQIEISKYTACNDPASGDLQVAKADTPLLAIRPCVLFSQWTTVCVAHVSSCCTPELPFTAIGHFREIPSYTRWWAVKRLVFDSILVMTQLPFDRPAVGQAGRCEDIFLWPRNTRSVRMHPSVVAICRICRPVYRKTVGKLVERRT